MSAALLTPAEMARADALTIAAGTPGILLMERAAAAIVEAIEAAFPDAVRVACLAGPGNNGGDAWAAAAILQRRGRAVAVFRLQPPEKLSGDAAIAAQAFGNEGAPLAAFRPEAFDLVVDGLFGAGLSRALEGEVAGMVDRLNADPVPVLSIDLPSGISGLTGERLGMAVTATATVTFFRAKPGHWLEPGRSHCGSVTVADIGIAPVVLDAIGPRTFANEPALWRDQLRTPADAGHKYDRGHAVVVSGGAAQTGAARLAATAALRGGAGLVTVLSPSSAVLVNATHLTAVMLKRCDDRATLTELLGDRRLNALVLGPGFGVGAQARDYAEAVLASEARLVLDADGITSFAEDPAALFALAAQAADRRTKGEAAMVLTPHAGEFKRLFPDLAAADAMAKPETARQAAARARSIVLLKGRDTVIAAPDGRAAINTTGTPWLATAGSGDVLSGLVAAALAQGAATFEAACAAVWMHGKAAEMFGPGLIAEDLPAMLPKVFARLAAG
ncbi:NAD(P)H-hydrate dehydratase [Jiella sp. MQZ9-1]|uniref:Bifunctional NAD(P)H-hydrate repair enzyme n=2 Tax=Jiella flava TaxID=2816857 RepID=A0A939JYH9_9HYPH|nr:NAD(P)H-hydrate dehydratase [Jiella flava]MCD2473067.1 NAD(P)H-hydrate dehydratase [Jiella flava]